MLETAMLSLRVHSQLAWCLGILHMHTANRNGCINKHTAVCSIFSSCKYSWSLHWRGGRCCLDWHRLLSPGRRCCGAGFVDIWWEVDEINKLSKSTLLSRPPKADRATSTNTHWTHSTARPFCMYSVMHLINWSFSSSNWRRERKERILKTKALPLTCWD